jgi:hypothetical protein
MLRRLLIALLLIGVVLLFSWVQFSLVARGNINAFDISQLIMGTFCFLLGISGVAFAFARDAGHVPTSLRIPPHIPPERRKTMKSRMITLSLLLIIISLLFVGISTGYLF